MLPEDLAMRAIFCAVLLLCATPLAVHSQEAKANFLTPQEIADGWVQLFDGESTFGWKAEGAKLDKGTLVVDGGDKGTKIHTTAAFGSFDLRFRYRSQGKKQVMLTDVNYLAPSEADDKGFMQCLVKERIDVAKRTRETELKVIEPKAVSAIVGGGLLSKVAPLAIGFEVPAGTRFVVHSIHIRPHGTVPIFNGKDLAGWKEIADPKRKLKSKFSVTGKGELNIKDGPGDIQTEAQWDDFVLQLDIISNGSHLNSGVFFRCLPGQFWSGYEAQIRNEWKTDVVLKNGGKLTGSYSGAGDRITLKVGKDTKKLVKTDIEQVIHHRDQPVDFGTGAIYNRQPARKVVSSDREWFTMTVLAHGNHLATWVNGVQVADFTDTRPADVSARKGAKVDKGPISLQGHDPTTDLSFRNMRVAELPKKR
jgi:hypothetical protein